MARGERTAVDSDVEDYFKEVDKVSPLSDKPGQQDMFDGDDDLKMVSDMMLGSTMAQIFEVKMAVILKPARDNAIPIAIPICRGKAPARYVEESIDICINSAYFRAQLRAAVGKASGELSVKLADAKGEQPQ